MPHWLVSNEMWSAIFGVGAPVVEKILRPAIVYVFLVGALRVFGKRELAQLNPFDLVVLLSLANTVQSAIIGNDDSLSGGLIGALTLLSVNYVVVRFLFKHRRLDRVFEGKPTVLIENGRILKEALDRELLTRSELMTVLYRQGFAGVEEVDKCVLEPGGTFAIRRKEPPASAVQHRELIGRLDEIAARLERLLGQSQA